MRGTRFVFLSWVAAAAGLQIGCASQPCACTFDPAGFAAHVDYLADDAREGRGLGTDGLEQAAEYIAAQFRAIGLQPAGDDGTYFQAFRVRLDPVLGDDGVFALQGVDAEPTQGADYIPFPFSSADAFEGDVVFAGYGIAAEDKGHDDYVHLDVTGKVVLMLRREPPTWADAEGSPTPYAEFSNKVYTAREHGAAAVLIVNQRPAEGEADELVDWAELHGGGMNADFGLPVFHVTRVLADRMLASGGKEALASLQDKADQGGYVSTELAGVRLAGRAAVARKEQPTRNVLGMLPGAGPHAAEVVVIGAHYDHLGVAIPRTTFGKKRERATAQPEVHNGADDNASGTAGVIEIARMLHRCGPRGRSVLFIAFTGEESGLLGSKHYVDHPTVALENVAAMLNMDMIGRLKPGTSKVQVFGTKAASGFEEMVLRLAESRGLEVQASGSAFGPSDHTSFYTKKIPAMHFFTGLHTDYHLPGDDADKINAEGAARVLGLVCDVACELIAAPDRPVYNRVAPPPADAGKGRFRVRMGIMPGYADSEDGMSVDGVLEDSPAEKAGMLDGDKIVRIGATKVKNVYDYMAALRNCNPGDEVEVVVVRDGRELVLKVVLAGG